MDGTLLDLLEQKVALSADKPLYSFLDRQLNVSSVLSYQVLYDRARGFAGSLQRQFCEGRPVLICCPHGPEFLIAFYACVLAGAWPVPVARNRARTAAGITSLMQTCGATTVITTNRRVAGFSHLSEKSELQVLAVDSATDESRHYRRPSLSGSDTAFIQYTSGSTSSPRGVVISHANVMHNAAQICDAFNCTQEDVGVSWLPFHHDMGLIGHVIQPLCSGIHNYFISPLDFMAKPARWLQAMSMVGGSLSGGPDFAYALATERVADHELAELGLGQWRLAYCGAEKIRPETLNRFAQRFAPCGFARTAIYPCYGLAESTLFVSGQHGLELHSRPLVVRGRPVACLGKPAAGTSVIIVHPDHGTLMGEGETGEVCVHSASVARCYFNDPVASNKVFNTIVCQGRGYCRTGDTGYMHQQRLFLLGRYKNVIKRRGCSYHTEDIEATLKNGLGMKLVARCAAFSVDDNSSERLVVLLEKTRAYNKQDGKSDRQLIGKAAAMVVAQFGIVPDDIRLLPVNTLPMTSSGKIRRAACLSLYQQLCILQRSTMQDNVRC